MKPAVDVPLEPAQPYTTWLEELPLSGAALADLMQAVLAGEAAFRFCARGSSMTPFICDGDVIVIAPLQEKQVRLGDVAAYRQVETGRLAVHRVVRRTGAVYWFQGDRLPGSFEGPIRQEAILGRVTWVERRGEPVRIGLGQERIVIALLSRYRLLKLMVRLAASGYRWWRRWRVG